MPYLPVMNLVAEHCHNLTKAGIDGLMLSWTVGGYPSPNLQLVKQFQSQPAPTIQQALTKLAETRYGTQAATDMLAAWSKFSSAFAEYPFHIQYVYRGPTQYGPANLLYPQPTGYSSTMVGFPYDDIEGWRAIYPADVLASQFEKMAETWQRGLLIWESALNRAATPGQHVNARYDWIIAQASYLHFKSVANQIRFILARNALLSGSPGASERQVKIGAIRAIVTDEIKNANVSLF